MWNLNARFDLALGPLVERKTRELAEVGGDDAPFLKNIEALFAELETAHAQSALPEDVPDRKPLSDFLVRRRITELS